MVVSIQTDNIILFNNPFTDQVYMVVLILFAGLNVNISLGIKGSTSKGHSSRGYRVNGKICWIPVYWIV